MAKTRLLVAQVISHPVPEAFCDLVPINAPAIKFLLLPFCILLFPLKSCFDNNGTQKS